MKRSFFFSICSLLSLALFSSGCGELNPSAPNSLGATVGGAQDIGYARNIIETGGIPNADFIVPEGLYSEHDIPTPPGECKERLCLSLGYGYAPAVDDGTENLFVHLGMTSTITPDQFKRPDLQLALVVDRSGSMRGTSINAVKDALRSLVPKLTEDDEVTLVEFNGSSHILLRPVRTDNNGKRRLLEQINDMGTGGGTNIEAGLLDGYEELARLEEREGRLKRVMLFTDAMPNIGATGKGSFRAITAGYADLGIGLTAFGVGVDFGQELVYHISRLQGGNFFFLQNEERIRTIFDEEFEYLVSPIVYDLKVRIETPPGAKLEAVYGLPDWEPGDQDAVLEIPTVFLSRNRGAIVLRYKATTNDLYSIESGQVIATGSIAYDNPDGGSVSNRRDLQHQGSQLVSGIRYFSHQGTQLGVALTNTYLALHLACKSFHESGKEDALDVLQRGIDYATSENILLNHEGLATEIALMEQLKLNIENQ